MKEIALVFLKLGTTAFGGPAAHIAMMEEEVVRKRGWLTREEFLDLLGATNFIPGPNSTELAIYIGHRRAGWPGLILAGVCFILPAALIVTMIAWAYVTYGRLPAVQAMLYGIKPVIIAVVLQAIWSLGNSAVKNKTLAALGVLAIVMNFSGVHELIVIAAAGLIAYLLSKGKSLGLFAVGGLTPRGDYPVFEAVKDFSLPSVFLYFLKVGSVLYGSGYVLIAFLRTDLVERWQLLTEAQLLDAIAVGQFTPGPVFTTATFIGYLLAGTSGAALATVGIFLPAFIFVALSAPFISRLRKSATASAILDGVNVGSLAVMSVTCMFLAGDAIRDLWNLTFAVLSGVLLLRYKINSAWLVLAGGVMGWLIISLN